MKKIAITLLLLVSSAICAQTVSPSQIKPGSNGQVITTTAGKTVWGSPATGGVTSVFGRIGDIAAQPGDYNCAQVTSAICSLPALYNQAILNSGAALQQRPNLNLIPGDAGSVACVDNPVTNSTDCTFTGGTSTGVTWQLYNVGGSNRVYNGTTSTIYQNATSYPMLVIGSIYTRGGDDGKIAVAQGSSMGSLTDVTWANNVGSTDEGGDAGFTTTIMPGNYYIVQVSGAAFTPLSSATTKHWYEIRGSGSGGGGGGSTNAVTAASAFTTQNSVPLALSTGTRAVFQSAWSMDNTNGLLSFVSGQGVGLTTLTTPVLAGTSAAASGSMDSATAHGNLAFVVADGSPAQVYTYDVSKATPVQVGSPYTLPSGGFGAVYIPKSGATDGSGYLAVGLYASNQVAILNVTAAGTVSAGAYATGITRANIDGNPYDPVTHTLYAYQRDQGKLSPIDLTSPLSPVVGSAITFTIAGATDINPHVAAPGNGYIYSATGDEGASSYAQVLTAAGAVIGQVAIDHAPQRMYLQGPYTIIAEHDSDELQIVDNTVPTAPIIASTINVSCALEEMTPIDGKYIYASGDGGCLVKIDISNPFHPVLVASTSSIASSQSIALAVAGHYLIGGVGSSVIASDIGGFYSPRVDADSVTARRVQADTLYTHNLFARGPVLFNDALSWGAGVAISSSSKVCQWDGTTATNCPPTSGGGFPITLGSTSIAASSTTTAVSGLGVDGATATEVGYLSGVTSAIQTQLNAKGSGTVTGSSLTSNAVIVGGGSQAIAALTTSSDKLLGSSGGTVAWVSTLPTAVTSAGQTFTASIEFKKTTGIAAFFGAADQGYITSGGEGDFIGLNSAGTLAAVGDGTHPGVTSWVGNTTAPSLGTSTAYLFGPSSTTFTSYALQLPTTAPSGGNQVMLVGSPSSSVSPVTFGQVPNAALANASMTVNGATCTLGSSCTPGIANTTTTVSSSTTVNANSCQASATTVTMTGLATTSTVNFTPNSDVSSVTGWGSSGGLTIDAWPSSTNTLSYKVCNQTGSNITTSGSVTFNVSAR